MIRSWRFVLMVLFMLSAVRTASAQSRCVFFTRDKTSMTTIKTALTTEGATAAALKASVEAHIKALDDWDPDILMEERNVIDVTHKVDTQQGVVNHPGATANDRKKLEELKLELRRAEAKRDAARAKAPPQTIVTRGVTRVSIMLANPTPERLRVSFDAANGLHHELEWDPAISSDLTRSVTLEQATWVVTVSSEPQKFSQQSGTVIIQVRFGDLIVQAPDVVAVQGTYVGVAIGTGVSIGGAVGVQRPTDLVGWPQPRLTIDCNQPSGQTIDQTRFPVTSGVAATPDGLRGFGVAPAIVADTLSLLAEIAIDRARAGALDILKQRLVRPFCTADSRIKLSTIRLGASQDLALPRTCALLESLRLDDVLASGRPLLAALRDDLRFTIAPAAATTIAGDNEYAAEALRAVVSILNSAIDRGSFAPVDGQLLLEVVAAFRPLTVRVTNELETKLKQAIARWLAAPNVPLQELGKALALPCGATNNCTAADIQAKFDALLAAARAPGGGWISGDQTFATLLAAAIKDAAAFAQTQLETLARDALKRAVAGARTGQLKIGPTELARFLNVQCPAAPAAPAAPVDPQAYCDDTLADELLKQLKAGPDRWLDGAGTYVHDPDRRAKLLAAATEMIKEAVRARIAASLDSAQLAALDQGIDYACQARLVVAIVKRCANGSCTAADIGDMLKAPGQFFAPDTALPQSLCWNGTVYRDPPTGTGGEIRRLILDGLELVAPVVDGRGKERAKAAVRLAATLVARLAPDPDGTLGPRLEAFAELATALMDEDYGTAFGRLMRLTETAEMKVPRDMRRFAELIGAVASYAVVYRTTADEDPKAAREARKRALSSIIDSFTDRTERGEEWIWSVGSNVGFGLTLYRDFASDTMTGTGADTLSWKQPVVRVPLQIRYERLAKRQDKPGTNTSCDWLTKASVGGQFAFQIADLGQFVRKDVQGDQADVHWADFVALGLEAGVSHACISRALNLSAHVSYAPTLEYDETTSAVGVWSVGASLSYYVPFLDLD